MKLRFCSALICALLSGCAAKPQLTYTAVSSNRDGAIKFTLPQSAIIVTNAKVAGGRPDVNSIPTDVYSNPKSLLVRGEQNLLQDTNLLHVTRLDGTDVVTSIGFQVVGHTEELIKTVTAVIPLIASSGGPAVVDTIVELKEQSQSVPLPRNEAAWNYTLTISPIKSDGSDGSIAYEDFASNLSSASAVFPTSHCRTATLRLIDSKNPSTTHEYVLKIADPTRVMLVRVPTKGVIKMHSTCGFDVTMETSNGLVDYGAWSAGVKFVSDLKAKLEPPKK